MVSERMACCVTVVNVTAFSSRGLGFNYWELTVSTRDKEELLLNQ